MTEPNHRPSFVRSKKFYVGIILLAALVLSSWYGASYYLQQLYSKSGTKTVEATTSLNMLFNYGNGTQRWSNSTSIPIGWSLFNATVSLTNRRVESKYYDSFGNAVEAINGVRNKNPDYWLIWIYCVKDHAWMFSHWGVDSLKPTTNGLAAENSLHHTISLPSNTVAWVYGGSDQTPPVSGARTVDFCAS